MKKERGSRVRSKGRGRPMEIGDEDGKGKEERKITVRWKEN